MARRSHLINGGKIKELRIAKGWTQDDLAGATSKTRGTPFDKKTIIVAERGGPVDLATIRHIAAALGVEPQKLLVNPGGGNNGVLPERPTPTVTPDSAGPKLTSVTLDSGDAAAEIATPEELRPDRSPSACEPHRGSTEMEPSRGCNAKPIWQGLVVQFGFADVGHSVRRFMRQLRGKRDDPQACVVNENDTLSVKRSPPTSGRRWCTVGILFLIFTLSGYALRQIHSLELHNQEIVQIARRLQAGWEKLEQVYGTASDPSQLNFSELDRDVDSILKLDPHNGYGLYMRGDIARFKVRVSLLPAKPEGCVFPAPPSFYDNLEEYIEIAETRGTEMGGHNKAETCFERPSGFCSQLTAYVHHLLAFYYYMQSEEASAEKENLLRRTMRHAKEAARYTDKDLRGFKQCRETMTILSLAEGQLRDLERRGN